MVQGTLNEKPLIMGIIMGLGMGERVFGSIWNTPSRYRGRVILFNGSGIVALSDRVMHTLVEERLDTLDILTPYLQHGWFFRSLLEAKGCYFFGPLLFK